jgi:hypothetical protein
MQEGIDGPGSGLFAPAGKSVLRGRIDMTLVPGLRMKGMTLCLAGGLAALPLVFTGNGAARAQPAAAAWNAGAPVSLPQPQPLPQIAPLTAPLCCATAAPPMAAQPKTAAPAAAAAAPVAPAAAPARRN